MASTVKTGLLASAAAAALCLSIGSAQATSAGSILYPGAKNHLSDNNAETFIDNNSNGVIDTGDVLTGIIGWNTVEATGKPTGFFGTGGVNDLSGVFSAMVTSTVSLGGGVSGFTFGVDPTFAATYGAGAMVALFDSSADYTRQGPTQASDILKATDGTLVMVWGIGADADDQWVAVGADTPVGAPGAQIATFNYNLSALFNGLTGPIDPITSSCFGVAFSFLNQNPCLGVGDGKVDIVGGGSVLIPDDTTAWPIWSNSDASFFVVPEPATMLLFGTGLLGAGVISRRRRKSA